MTDRFDLTGRLAVVTGARRGIGLAMAEALAAAGADIVAVSESIEAGRAATPSGWFARTGATSPGWRRTSRTRRTCDGWSGELVKLDRPIDILVNNAGTIARAPAAEHSDEDWAHVLQVNLTSQFVLAREIGRGMLDRGRGKIIFTASLLSFQGGINVPGYAAAKSGLVGLTKALSNEWASRGVNVNAIAPGYIATDNTKALQEDPVRRAAILDRIPAGRWGEASDIAGATVFLASSASDYVNGIVLPVDGGWLGR